MDILIINPNSTASMTEKIKACAMDVALDGTSITAVNPEGSPPAIEGAEDGEAALPHLFSLFDKITKDRKFDAAIIACFDDTGLWQLKGRNGIPVIGIGEAAFQTAMLTAKQFSVVTTLPVSIPVIDQNLSQYGYHSRCKMVRACDVPVLDLEQHPKESYSKLSNEIGKAKEQDNSEAIVLGCAGMADLAKRLTDQHGLPVIDGVKSAVGLCEMLGRS